MENESGRPPRLVVCLVAGKDAAEQYPTLLRYLQVGLIDESVGTLRVVMQGEPLTTLQTGTSIILQDRPLAWPLTPWSRRAFIANVQLKLESVQRGSPAIVHGLAASSADWAAQIAALTGSELVLSVSSWSQTRDAASLQWLQKAAAILTLSPQLRDALPPAVQANKPVEVVHVGLAAGSAPAAFKNAQRAPVIVFAGSLSEDCGVDCLLRAVKQVLTRHPNLLLFVIGKGHAEDNLRRLAESLEINESVTFTGKLDDWRGVLDSADIFCVPSPGRVWREEPLAALAAGVCVVAAEGQLCDELIDGRTALLFPPDDDAALARQLFKLLGDPATARSLASAGQELVRQHNTPAGMVAEHLRVYQQLAGRHQTLAFPAART